MKSFSMILHGDIFLFAIQDQEMGNYGLFNGLAVQSICAAI